MEIKKLNLIMKLFQQICWRFSKEVFNNSAEITHFAGADLTHCNPCIAGNGKKI